MGTPDFLTGANAAFIEQLEEQYRADPESLDPTWRAFFAGMDLARGEKAASGPAPGSASAGNLPRTFGIVNGYRDLGHLLADIDPLSEPPQSHPLLDLAHFSLSEEDLARPSGPGGFHGTAPETLGDLVGALRETYCSTLGVEFTQIRDSEQREWLEDQMEPQHNRPQLDRATKLLIYTKLTEAESFEQFLHKKFPGQKRFSLEGGETLIPSLEMLVEECAEAGVEQIVLGMAHRGRLNVLANLVRKPYEMIFAEFEGSTLPDWVQGDGDVKYHQGYSRDHHAACGNVVHVSLTPNPSHLEAVNPVVEGKVRAKQNLLGDAERDKVLPVLVHGDASFVGQGVVPETLLLTHLDGYFTGGTIHIVVNNQIGFTTPPESSRPMRYATDIARIIESPVFHVNGDDPEMAIHAIDLAVRFRQQFKRDVVIDLVCFRKHGHNEMDEPTFTQPTMYRKIKAHPGVRKLYADRLVAEGSFTPAELTAIETETLEVFDLALQYARDFRPRQQVFSFGDSWEGLGAPDEDRGARTGVSADELRETARKAADIPAGVMPHPKVLKQYEQRVEMVERGSGIDWGCAEMLAFGSLLRDGIPIRLSGQDSGRGTFSHRHSVLHDQENGQPHLPLNHFAELLGTDARYEVIDSPLSEEAVLGFEYGHASASPRTLTIWEAQFGDFANGAQIIIDTYLAAGESKWQRASGLVLLLPHGYEGQGPEHSSARLERFLQLCADDNLQVVVPTTAAQYFHVLRRQIVRPFRKPLVVMTPKSLLRFAPSSSALEELTGGAFSPVLPDPVDLDPGEIQKLVLCSGKVFYDLARARQERPAPEVAIVRIEELYPFPTHAVKEAIDRYPNAKDVVWCQDEPINMGPWWYVSHRLPQLVGDDRSLRFAGREEAASPATGSYGLHKKEQDQLLADVFEGGAPVPTPKKKAPGRSRVPARTAGRRAQGG